MNCSASLFLGLRLVVGFRNGTPTMRLVTAPELASSRYPTFHKLKNLGLHATNIHDPAGEQYLATLLQQRANRNPAPYRHWFLDTAGASGPGGTVTYLSYRQSDPIRRAVVSVMQHAVVSGTGPEWLRSKMATLTPAECNADAITSDLVLQHFILDLFANGSGTQVYSTSFAQWSAREIIRRAKPQTLFIKIGSRVRQQSLNELIAATGNALQLDHAGSLIDADLAVHYTWLEVAKLPAANKAVFCAWYPGHGEAFIIGPGIPRGVSTANPIGIADLINMTA